MRFHLNALPARISFDATPKLAGLGRGRVGWWDVTQRGWGPSRGCATKRRRLLLGNAGRCIVFRQLPAHQRMAWRARLYFAANCGLRLRQSRRRYRLESVRVVAIPLADLAVWQSYCRLS